jgi:hypothetical protein
MATIRDKMGHLARFAEEDEVVGAVPALDDI